MLLSAKDYVAHAQEERLTGQVQLVMRTYARMHRCMQMSALQIIHARAQVQGCHPCPTW